MCSCQSVKLQHCLSPVALYLKQIADLITEKISSSDEDIAPLFDHITSHRGKMLRPGLVLLSGLCTGGVSDAHIETAAIVEMLHIATLMHDDVIDKAEKRRSKETVNSLWGNKAAVLAGDYILAKIFSMCIELDKPQVLKELAETTRLICHGELAQNVNSDIEKYDENKYINIITEKTARLLGSCCFLGGVINEASEQQTKTLRDYGVNIGVAFQIRDDVLDIVGDEKKTGKTLGTDNSQNKPTLALLHYIQSLSASQLDEFIVNEHNPTQIADILLNSGSVNYAMSKADQYKQTALKALQTIENCPAKQSLTDLAEFMVAREN